MWTRVEAIHAVTYFASESREAAKACGLKGFWTGYFGFRAAPLAAVGTGVVEAAFYNFVPEMVRRSIPDAWSFARPEELVVARRRAAAAALRAVAGELFDDLAHDDHAALLRDLDPLVDQIERAGVIPFPNPMGLPRRRAAF